jgi:hypothetical protein
MGRAVSIVLIHRAGRFVRRHFLQTSVPINRRQIRRTNRLILVEQQSRAKQRAIFVPFLRLFQIRYCRIQLILLLPNQRAIKPGRRIVRIEPNCQIQFAERVGQVVRLEVRLAQITPEDATLRFHQRRHLQILTTLDKRAATHFH